MTLATAYRNKIDALWLDFHSGGITNPITVIEQISYLMFARLLDITESREEKRSARLKKDFKRLFPADKQHLRWSHFRNEGGDRMLTIVRDEFFPFMRTNLQQHPLGRYLKDANCLIPSGNLLSRAVATRLALAEILATDHDGTLPILFDDAFAYTDPDRVQSLQRMLDLAAVRGLQIIILTCTPNDYSALGALSQSFS